MIDVDGNSLDWFGWSSDRGGPHLARTMMLADLRVLMDILAGSANSHALQHAVEVDNVLAKPTSQARRLAWRHLAKLYALDASVPLFRAMAYLWQRDATGRPLLALLAACVRDPVLRSATPWLLDMKPGQPYQRQALERCIDDLAPGRFSASTLTSAAQNIAGTWTQSGHLRGRTKKCRQQVEPTSGSVALALLVGHVRGLRGQLLFESEFVKLLDCRPIQAMELAEAAAARGWINFKRIGPVVETAFPKLLPHTVAGGAA